MKTRPMIGKNSNTVSISTKNLQHFFMQQALEQASIAFERGEIPVGAVIVHRERQEIIAVGHNLVETKHNPTLHAEIVAINTACKTLQSKHLSGCDIYVSLE